MPVVANTVNIDEALLERVEPRVVQQLPKRMLFLNLAERVAAKAQGGGRSYIIVIKTQFGESFRALREAEPVPDPSSGKHERLQVSTKLMAATFDVTALAEAISDGKDNSLIDIVKDGTTDLMDSYKRNWSRSMYLTGDGAVAKVDTVSLTASKTFKVLAPSIANRWGTTYLRPGMRISASVNVTAGDYIAERGLDAIITDVDPATLTITVDQGIDADLSAGDFIFIGGPRFTSKNREWQGLLSAIDDGGITDPYLTKARTGAGGSLWQSTVSSSVGTKNIERELIVAATKSWQKSDEMFSDLISTPGVHNSYIMPFMAGRTWAQGQQAMEGVAGFTKMPIVLQGRKLDWWLDPDCPKGTIFGMPKQHMQIVEVKKPGFWVGDGGKPVRSTTNLVSRFIFWGAGDFICKRPNAAIRLDGVTEIPA